MHAPSPRSDARSSTLAVEDALGMRLPASTEYRENMESRVRSDPRVEFTRPQLEIWLENFHLGIPFTPSWATNINLIDSAGKSWDQIATPFLSADSSPFVAEHAPSGPPTLLHTDSSCSTQTFNGQFETEDECSATPLSRDLQDFMGPENRCSAGTSLPFALTPPRKCSRAPLPCPDNPEKHCCYAIASSTLDSLHHESDCSTANVDTTSRSPAHVLQPRGSGPLSLTLDHILRQNKVAVRNVARLLACSCIHDPHLVMLCGSIISKVLLWYQAAAGVGSYPSSSEGLSQTFTASPFSFPRSGHATVALLPLTVGDFCLDEEDQETLGRQLLLSELGKLGQLIDRLREKHDEVGDQAHMDLGNLYMTLGRWLKSELVRTMREVDERGTGKRYLSEDRFRS
ncbi:hypothetical protein MMC20_001070 [Loxospora ochrophaea]|nr:hypothetical protein [Loxospora ochrophaea]